jgi:hypothetical protein
MFDDTGEAGLLLRRQVPGQVENTHSASACITCVATATITTTICGIGCFFFGIGCSCAVTSVVDIPRCYGAGGGCCPVACGPSVLLGLFPSSCCHQGDTCLDPSSGRCCQSGLQACGGTTCCPSSAPCRNGICCPVNRDVCTTPSGPVCCNIGQACAGGQCCPIGLVRNGSCCSPDVCCVPGTLSRCFRNGIQTCGVDGLWRFTPCAPPRFCLGIPVANAGVFCIGVGSGGF